MIPKARIENHSRMLRHNTTRIRVCLRRLGVLVVKNDRAACVVMEPIESVRNVRRLDFSMMEAITSRSRVFPPRSDVRSRAEAFYIGGRCQNLKSWDTEMPSSIFLSNGSGGRKILDYQISQPISVKAYYTSHRIDHFSSTFLGCIPRCYGAATIRCTTECVFPATRYNILMIHESGSESSKSQNGFLHRTSPVVAARDLLLPLVLTEHRPKATIW